MVAASRPRRTVADLFATTVHAPREGEALPPASETPSGPCQDKQSALLVGCLAGWLTVSGMARPTQQAECWTRWPACGPLLCRLRFSELAILAQYAPEDAALQQLAASADAFSAWAAELQVRGDTTLAGGPWTATPLAVLACFGLVLPGRRLPLCVLTPVEVDISTVTAACHCCPRQHIHTLCVFTCCCCAASLAGPV